MAAIFMNNFHNEYIFQYPFDKKNLPLPTKISKKPTTKLWDGIVKELNGHHLIIALDM